MNLKYTEAEELMWHRWENNAINSPDKDAIVVWRAEEEPFRWSFKSLFETALKYSCALKKNGVKGNDVCAIILKPNQNFYPIYMGVSLLGAIPAVLAYPNPRLHPDKFRQGIEGMSHRSGLDWILTTEDINPIIDPLIHKNTTTIKGMHYPLNWDIDALYDETTVEEIRAYQKTRKPEDPFLLQHSSGTTGLQKPVLLSHKAVLEHVKNYAKAIDLRVDDKVITWLPLYHDMGLIAAFHLPLAYGITSVQLDTFEWVLIPSLLLEAGAKEKGTLTWLPNFAYNVLADKVHDDELEGISLSNWRMFINCSEPVRNESHNKFYNRFKEYGLNKKALTTCYAMAETTYAVTQSSPNDGLNLIYADRNSFSKDVIKPAEDPDNSRVCVSSGKLIDECKIKIVDDKKNELPDDVIGEIAIWSVSMFSGYRNYPEKTADVLIDGWYYSGDYGFKHDDEYFVIGRKKDIIISTGNNIYPEDVEDQLNKVEGVIPGRVIAFGEYSEEVGSEQVSVAVETKIADEEGQKKLKLNILKAGMAMDVTIKNIYLLPSRWLIKSSAGKPSRKANKERLLNKEEEIIWSC